MREIIISVILGALQGVAEFLPISSSGHLVIFQRIFDFGDASSNITFDIMLHFATLISIFLVYYKDLWELIKEAFAFLGDLFKGKPNVGKNDNRKLIYLIIIATIPTLILALIIEPFADFFSKNVKVVGALLLVTSVMLYFASKKDNGTKGVKEFNTKDSLLIGLMQGIAVLPGISRSGSTISASFFRGINKETAVKFSFFTSIPIILAAMLKDIVFNNSLMHFEMTFLYGMITATIVGYFSIKLLIKVLKEKKYQYFAYYCFLAGILTILFL